MEIIKRKRILGIFAVLLAVFLINFVFAEKLGLDIENKYSETGEINFKITVYNDSNNPILGIVSYKIRNYYGDVVKQGDVNSGEWINFKLPVDIDPRPWEIIASYNGIETSEKFNLGELRKVDISLEGDNLVLRNIGNVPYEGHILIYIGNEDVTASVYLARGQTKKIKLTAPEGVYDVKVDTGEEEEIVFSKVGLTGNVIGLERIIEGSFWKKYPIVTLFLIALGMIGVLVFSLKFSKNKIKKS